MDFRLRFLVLVTAESAAVLVDKELEVPVLVIEANGWSDLCRAASLYGCLACTFCIFWIVWSSDKRPPILRGTCKMLVLLGRM